jgi:hypothetical protein
VGDRLDQAPLDRFAGQRTLAPVRDRHPAGVRRFAGQGHDGADLFRGERRRRPRTRRIGQPVSQRQIGLAVPAPSPAPDCLNRNPQPASTLPIADPLGGQQDDPAAQRQLLRRRMPPDQTVQLLAFNRTQHDGLSRSRHGSLRSIAIGHHSIPGTKLNSTRRKPRGLPKAVTRWVAHFRRPELGRVCKLSLVEEVV